MLAVRLLLVLVSITVLFLRGEAEAVCGQRSSLLTIPALPGKPGKSGAPGEPGPNGEVGVSGRNGSDGAPGPQGPVGPVGPQGTTGMNGTDGEQGPIGPQGPVGPSGLDGRDGVDGRNGSDGLPGPPGTISDAVIEQLKEEILDTVRRDLICRGDRETYHATSCKEVYECDPNTPSGYYWINTDSGTVQDYCEMETNNCGDTKGGWMRAAYVDMTNVSNTCPQGLNYTVVGSTRMCTRSHSDYPSCSSVTFPLHGVTYTKVCGRAQGYQYFNTPAFYSYYHSGQTTLDSAYADGLSVTYGNPRNQVWTFAAGQSKGYSGNDFNCPCAATYPGPAAPPFVGENYFCESENTGPYEEQWYLDDPLWDSQGCACGSTCCNRGGPWFTTTLNQEVSSDIEVRMCLYSIPLYVNIGVEQLEIFVY